MCGFRIFSNWIHPVFGGSQFHSSFREFSRISGLDSAVVLFFIKFFSQLVFLFLSPLPGDLSFFLYESSSVGESCSGVVSRCCFSVSRESGACTVSRFPTDESSVIIKSFTLFVAGGGLPPPLSLLLSLLCSFSLLLLWWWSRNCHVVDDVVSLLTALIGA